MKYFVIFLILIVFATSFLFGNYAYGLWVPQSTDELLEKSETIFVGTVTAIAPIDVEYQNKIARNGTVRDSVGPEVITLEEYTVDVEEFLKNPQESDTMIVLQATVGGVPSGPAKISGFDPGDRVLFFVPKSENQTHLQGQYLPESFKIPEYCDAQSVLGEPTRISEGPFIATQDGVKKQREFTASIPIQFGYQKKVGLSGNGFDVLVSIVREHESGDEIVFEQKVHADSEQCKWLSTATWEIVPVDGKYRMSIGVIEDGLRGSGLYTNFVVRSASLEEKSPLKQFRSGIPLDEVKCKEGLKLILKSSDDSPACVKPDTKQKLVERKWAKDNEDLTVDWKKHTTLSAARIDSTSVGSLPDVLKLYDLVPGSVLHQALVGADGCKNKTEVCAMTRGFTLEKFYPFGISVSGSDDYTITLDVDQSNRLLSNLDWRYSENWIYAIVQWDGKYYFLILSTFDQAKTPDVAMDVIGSSYEPVFLDKGGIMNYTIHVSTWATYGAPARIDLRAVQSAKDSGVDVWVEPATLIIPERSSATATLFVQPQQDAKEGIYNVRVTGTANGKNAGLHCGNTVCPTVAVGDSDWLISTFGTSSGKYMGGGEAPTSTWMEIELNKEEFFEGDIAEIKAYLINNGTEPISLSPEMDLLIKVIKAEQNGYYDHFYGIDAVKVSGEPIMLEANSKTLLARPFYWNQTTFSDIDEWRVEPGRRLVTADLAAGGHAWSSEIWIEIKK